MRYGYNFGNGYNLGNGPGVGMHVFGIVPAIIGSLLMLALLTLTVILIIKVIKFKNFSLIRKNNTNGYTSSALSILNERYAKGEISAEEYMKMKTEIAQSNY